MCLACLFRLMDLRTRYTHVFSALASGRSASWAKLVMGETRGYPVHILQRVANQSFDEFDT